MAKKEINNQKDLKIKTFTAKEYATIKGFNERTKFYVNKIFINNEKKTEKEWEGEFISHKIF